MAAPAVLAIGALGAGYVLLDKEGKAAAGTRADLPTKVPSPGGAPQDRITAGRKFTYGINTGISRMAHPYIDGGGKATTAMQQAFREAEERIKKEYEELSSDGKKAAAAAVNAELGTTLTGDESFEEVGAVVGAALGGVAASAACAAVGLGGIALGCKALGAIAGAYLGKKVSEYMGDAWDEVSDWASDQWDSIGDGAEEAWGAVGDALGIW